MNKKKDPISVKNVIEKILLNKKLNHGLLELRIKDAWKKLKKMKKTGKDTIKSLYKWVDLPDYINKDSKCEHCGKTNVMQHIKSTDLIGIATNHYHTFYRCKNCKILIKML